MRILIVDRSRTTRRMILNAIRQADASEFLEASSSREALQRMDHRRADVFILGSDLDDRTGIEFTKYIRELPTYKKAPILMVSGLNTHEDLLDAVDAGVDTYVLLPFREESLLAKVRAALVRARQLAAQKPQILPLKKGYIRRRHVGF